MNKRYIFAGIFAGLLLWTLPAAAQDEGAEVLVQGESVPGAMFSVDALRNTSATSTISGNKLYKNTAVNVSNSLAGMLPGLTIMQGSGHPGHDNALWLIRGIGTHDFAGYNTCKIFVDGFEVNSSYFTSLTPAEIESVSVLKDGGALTLFGDRGANGIIWIETKRGRAGRATVDINIRSGIQAASVINKPLDSFDYAYNYNLAASNDKGAWSPVYNNAQLTAYRDGTGVNVDWYDEVMRDMGYYVDGDVTFNGGNEYARYNVVLGYLNQQGLFDVKNDKDRTSNLTFARYNLRANLDFNIGRIFEVSVDIGGKLWDYRRPRYNMDDLMKNLATYPNNIYNVYDDAARTMYSGTTTYPDNPVGTVKGLGYRLEHSRVLQGNFTLKQKLDMVTPGLYLMEAFSIYSYTTSSQNKTANYARYINGEAQTTDKDDPISAGGWGSDGMEDWKHGIIAAGYDRAWGAHRVTGSVGMHLSAYKGDGYFSYKYNYLNYRGRVNYMYDNRLVGEVSLSTFGNDAYAKDQRWSVYPAVSGAWILSNEGFMAASRNVDILKLRASFGMTGGSDSNSTNELDGYGSNGRFLHKNYYFNNVSGSFYTGSTNGNWQTTLAPMFVANPDAHSETAYKYNLGLDAALFGNKLTLTADVFFEKRKDILTWNNSLLGYYGYNYYISNIGEMTNRGFEVMGIFSERRGDWSYSLLGMISFNRNKIKDMDEVATKYGYNAATGKPYGSVFGLVADGFYTEADFENGSLRGSVPAYGQVQPGDIKYRDLDNNGVIDDDDITKIGKSIYPEWTYTVSGTIGYRNFDLGVMLQGIAGASANMLDMPELTIPFIDNRTIYKIADNSWAYYPDQGIDNRRQATYPRLTTEQNDNNYRNSSFWMRKLNFMKVRHIELGYTFKTAGSAVRGARVYFNASNPFTVSKLQRDYDIDPELLGYGYPALRTFTLGVSLSF